MVVLVLCAMSPAASCALTVIVSEPWLGSLTVTVARSAFTSVCDPVIVRWVVPEPDTPLPVAESNPDVSDSVTVRSAPFSAPCS